MDEVLVDVTDGVATITINRPEARNALNRAVRKALPQIVTACEADDAVDVMILTGADPAFSAGVDLKEIGAGAAAGDDLRSGPADGPAEAIDMGGRNEEGRLPWRGALPPRTKLLIGAVNGVAVTGGFELALGCDFLIASDRARFADTHARVGVMPGWGLTVLLPQRVGVARAREMSVTGNFIDAAAGVRVGARQPRRAARRAVGVLPAARRRLPHHRPDGGAAHARHLRREQPHHHRRRVADRGPRLTVVGGLGVRSGGDREAPRRDHGTRSYADRHLTRVHDRALEVRGSEPSSRSCPRHA